MARPPDPPLGSQARLRIDTARYYEIYHFMAEHMRKDPRKWGSRTRAEKAAAKKFRILEETAGDRYDKMIRSLKAATDAPVKFLPEPEMPEWAADALRFFDSGVAVFDREQQQEHFYVQQLMEHPIEFAFTAPERRLLRRVKRSFAVQLAMERLELIELRKKQRSRT